MSKKEEATEEKAIEFDVMPGADKPEEDDGPQLDLSFETPEEEPEKVAEEEEEVVAEDATEEPVAEESEEAVAEDEGSEPETDSDEEVEEEEVNESSSKPEV